MRQRSLAAACAALAMIFAVPAAAMASGEYEPNDTPATATGPIADGTYSATIETGNDQDWYRVETSVGDVQVQIDNTNDSGCDYCPIVLAITDADGSNLDSNGTYAQPSGGGKTDHAAYTLREAGTYYVKVESNGRAGLTYHFTLSRAGGGPYEPNDRTGTATGPIADGTYAGALETANDQDWYRVETVNRDVQVQIDNTNDGSCDYCPIVLAITDSRGSNLDDTGTYAQPSGGGETDHAAYTLREPGTYYLKVESGSSRYGLPYHFSITRSQGTPVEPPPPPPPTGPSAACRAARSDVRSARRALAKAKARYRRHHTRANRRKVTKAKRRLRNALADRRVEC